ncbi:MAG: thymidylate synthase [Richelia sp. CSU_2_1]|nr:thymidylate synthase [Richelia sp. CSU_2_1]
MKQYAPISENNEILCGTGNTAIVTGWTPVEAIARHLEPHEYAAVGSLYSIRGIDLLVRNLLANPHTRFAVTLDATRADKNSGAIECLLWFVKYGFVEGVTEFGNPAWVIDCNWQPDSGLTFQGKGYIDNQIPKEVLNNLRKNISWIVTDKVQDCINEVRAANKTKSQPWGEPKIYPIPEVEAKLFPGQKYGHRIEGKTIAETWVKIIHRIKTTGTLRPTGYGGQWQELIDLMAVITDEPEEFYFPEPNYLPIDRTFLEQYKPQILEDAPYVEGVKYTYGQRMRSWFGRDQIEEVIVKLIKEIDAASAVINLWDAGGNTARRADGSSDHHHSGSPCLNHVWVRVANGELSLTAVFRSNDMFAAWPANAMGLRALQQYICSEINDRESYCGQRLVLGPLIIISESAHIYGNCFDFAGLLIAQHYDRNSKEFNDPIGNFVISVRHRDIPRDKGEIRVDRISPGPDGELVQSFFGTKLRELVDRIISECPGIEPSHSAYLGIELMRASICLISGEKYVQK